MNNLQTTDLQPLDEMLAQAEAIVSPVSLVGGCVRDALLGRPITDYDLTTPLTPDEVEEMVRAAGRRPYTVGKRYGTIGFKVQGNIVEVTTYRHETYEPHSRHPKVAYVTDITQDLARRDLTINAIAYNGQLVDPFGGQEDLKNHIIRAVGHAPTRMQEDPLRILRVCRFASQLGFDIEEETLAACKDSAPLIFDVPAQRWSPEVDKLLTGQDTLRGLKALADTGLLPLLFPLLGTQVKDNPSLLTLLSEKIAGLSLHNRWALAATLFASHLARNIDKSLQLTAVRGLAEQFINELSAKLYWSNKRTADTRSAVQSYLS